jgi:hypothetical protein
MKITSRNGLADKVLLILSALFYFTLLYACALDIRNKCDSTQVHAQEVTLTWDSHSGPGLAGYKIYYKTCNEYPRLGPPYTGTGIVEGDSPILVPLGKLKDPHNPEFTIHGLDKTAIYFFAVTAYDSEGKESNYSKEIRYPPKSKK